MNILAVIPARGGSKGIPRKNVRILNGKSLIAYVLNNAKACTQINDIVVTSDDEEILNIAKDFGVDYMVRNAALAGDKITLDPVVCDAVEQMERKKKVKYDIILTMQPTSPLLKVETLERALMAFIDDKKDSYISVVNRAHLTWSRAGRGFIPNYQERVNRQQLPPLYFETGAFFISRRQCVKPNERLGTNIGVFEISEDEATDIDNATDWLICENILKKKRIVFRTDGYKQLGMGHIYRCLTLAYGLTGHEIMFVMQKQHTEGVSKVASSYIPYTLIDKNEDFFMFLEQWKADIIINDCLDTSQNYVKRLKTLAQRVITFEDLGEGAKHADAVINALYHEDNPASNYYCGEKYFCLRDEFLFNHPKAFSEEVKEVLVLFGGTDPANLTKKIYDVARKMSISYSKISFTFIIGQGYNIMKNEIKEIPDQRISVLSNVKLVSNYMQKSDLAFTSQGRTVFELASLGVPSIVLAQNKREQLHTFAQMQNGFLNLGLGSDVSTDTIESTFKWLVDTPQVRLEMRNVMLRHDLKSGIKHVLKIILEENKN
jgi:CMP-N-acetylneuraminic acid synthetase/spore coat polysaccharide biosynthesis predicted glycosyltransferase SpsG